MGGRRGRCCRPEDGPAPGGPGLDLNWRGVAARAARGARVGGARFYGEFMDPRSWPAHMRARRRAALEALGELRQARSGDEQHWTLAVTP